MTQRSNKQFFYFFFHTFHFKANMNYNLTDAFVTQQDLGPLEYENVSTEFY